MRLPTRFLRLTASGAAAIAVAFVLGPAGKGTVASGALYMSPAGSDGGQCTATQPCRSFSRAYAVAHAGQTVLLASGDYPSQTIAGSKSGAKIVFQPAPGARVSTGYLRIYADAFELRNMRVDSYDVYAGSTGFTARGLVSGVFGVWGSDRTSIIGGSVGPSYKPGGSSTPVYITYGDEGTVAPTNLLIDGVTFHDFRRGSAEDHMECIMVVGGVGITIRDSRFKRCDIFDIFFTQWAGPDPPRNILLENNWFGTSTTDGKPVGTTYGVRFSDHMDRFDNITVRYNSATQEFSIDEGPKTNVSFIANVAPMTRGACVDGVTYLYNVWDGNRCSPTDRNAPSRFVDEGNADLAVSSNAAAVNHGDPKSYPRRDIFGHRRPRGRLPDAGAVEVR